MISGACTGWIRLLRGTDLQHLIGLVEEFQCWRGGRDRRQQKERYQIKVTVSTCSAWYLLHDSKTGIAGTIMNEMKQNK